MLHISAGADQNIVQYGKQICTIYSYLIRLVYNVAVHQMGHFVMLSALVLGPFILYFSLTLNSLLLAETNHCVDATHINIKFFCFFHFSLHFFFAFISERCE